MDSNPELSPTEPAALDARANEHLLRGLSLLESKATNDLREAVRCFDRAISLRAQLPLAANPWYRYGLIAGYLNRGDALTRLGSTDNLAAAVAAFDEGLRHLRELPMHESPLFVKRLTIAWLNRGIALSKQRLPGSLEAASESFSEAIAAAKHFFSLTPNEGRSLLASAWFNHANTLIQFNPPQAEIARAAAHEALKVIAVIDSHDATAADIGFRSRHVLCQALAHLLAEKNDVAQSARDVWWHEATDAVDSGMALARQWETRGTEQFRDAATALFRFGCRVYQLHQPHFLTEFLLENLDPEHSPDALRADTALHASAAEALWQRLAELHRNGFQKLSTPEFQKTLAQLREVRLTHERLHELQRALKNA